MMHSVSDDCCFAVASTEKNEKKKNNKAWLDCKSKITTQLLV